MKKWMHVHSLHILTFLSFLTLLACLLCFAAVAPGNYQFDAHGKNTVSSVWDAVFAVFIAANCICVLLSLLDALKVSYTVLKRKCWNFSQLLRILLGIYPTIVVLYICSWDCNVLINYIFSPVRILSRMI